jgi:hypothetical protein
MEGANASVSSLDWTELALLVHCLPHFGTYFVDLLAVLLPLAWQAEACR